MNADEARTVILETLGALAPEADFNHLPPTADLRETLDLDSVDFLNFVTALHQRSGRDIPEADYPKLATLERAIAYLQR